jgi:hypothetical protein
MSEAEWLACTDPVKMLTFFFPNETSDRKRRLFAVACCRSVAHLMTDSRSLEAVAAAERYADGLIDEGGLASARSAAAAAQEALITGPTAMTAAGTAVAYQEARSARVTALTAAGVARVAVESPWAWTAKGMAPAAAGIAAEALELSAESSARAAVAAKVSAAQVDLVREVFGNPWRCPALAPGTSPHGCAAALAIARRAYEEGDFRALPIVADALEDASCADAGLLDHLRGPGPHVRGCWAVDLLLGKS